MSEPIQFQDDAEARAWVSFASEGSLKSLGPHSSATTADILLVEWRKRRAELRGKYFERLKCSIDPTYKPTCEVPNE